MIAQVTPAAVRSDRYQVSVQEYLTFREHGFLVVRGLVAPAEISELRQHTEDLMQGRLDQQLSAIGIEPPPAHLSPTEKAQSP